MLIYIHKEAMLDDVQDRYPARRWVVVDDKVRILAAMKAVMKERLTTVFPRQGHYALDSGEVAKYPRPDVTVELIADLLGLGERAYQADWNDAYRLENGGIAHIVCGVTFWRNGVDYQ